MGLDKDTIDFITEQNAIQTRTHLALTEASQDAIKILVTGIKKEMVSKMNAIIEQNKVRNNRLEKVESQAEMNHNGLMSIAQNCQAVQQEKPHDYVRWDWIKGHRWWIIITFVLATSLISLLSQQINWGATAKKQAEKQGIELKEIPDEENNPIR